MEKQKSFSGPSGATGPDLGAWKARMRTAEMDADRAEKELEIARWRLAVLEEERIAGEVEVRSLFLSSRRAVTDGSCVRRTRKRWRRLRRGLCARKLDSRRSRTRGTRIRRQHRALEAQ